MRNPRSRKEILVIPSQLKIIPAVAIAAFAAIAGQAGAAAVHVVQPGETLWSIAAANNLTTRTVAVYNGMSESTPVYSGQAIEVPTEMEGASALAASGVTTTDPTSSTASSTPSTTSGTVSAPTSPPPPEPAPSWTLPVYCPSCPGGSAYLASNAASAWSAMRQDSLRLYGIDLFPAGSLSAYRSYAQQLYLYTLYQSGQGSLAAPPSTSSHEYGVAVDLADPAMANAIDLIGAQYGWAKTEAPGEWWHVNYIGP